MSVVEIVEQNLHILTELQCNAIMCCVLCRCGAVSPILLIKYSTSYQKIKYYRSSSWNEEISSPAPLPPRHVSPKLVVGLSDLLPPQSLADNYVSNLRTFALKLAPGLQSSRSLRRNKTNNSCPLPSPSLLSGHHGPPGLLSQHSCRSGQELFYY